MITLIAYVLTFAIAGAMLAVMMLACFGVLMLAYAIYKGFKMLHIKIRAHLRHRRAVREFNEKYKNAKEDIHVL